MLDLEISVDTYILHGGSEYDNFVYFSHFC